MNADGSRGVATMSQVEVQIPHLGTVALVALIAGLVALAGGIALIVPAMRGSQRDTDRRYSEYNSAQRSAAPTR